ncbi:hypothetical protein [Pseudomonas sp.]|uniref:hypothetical protein n=1 Tax=Pseudomonas sp. TaxID=306 RepID=UPI0035A17E5C
MNHTILFLAFYTLLEKAERFELSFFNAWLVARPSHPETFAGMKPQHASCRNVLGKFDIPTLAKASIFVAEWIEYQANRQVWASLIVTDKGGGRLILIAYWPVRGSTAFWTKPDALNALE